jgi:hypothetical protein
MADSVMVALQILVLFVRVQILLGQLFFTYGPFVYRLGWKILSLQRGVRFP